MSSISQAVCIYQPTEAEILPVMNSARSAWPLLTSRIDKAQELLVSTGIRLEPCAWNQSNVVRWQVLSQSFSHWYIVTGCHNACGCPDRGLCVGDLRFCKHNIAVAAYRRILKERFNAHVQAREIDLGILPNGEFLAYPSENGVRPIGHCQIVKDKGTYAFVDCASAVRYSIWLAKQQAGTFVSYFNTKRELVAA